ncbi:MAG TPA: YetF domain-containing protein [Pyrinomonadaceae bacterium]|nr:YetF domain-containing protein [Pyrinomonadaceae bacterium]
MFQDWWEKFVWAIGGSEIDPGLSPLELILRTIVIYVVGLLIIRVGKRRFMGSFTTFDILLGFVVGSVMSRAITGTVRFIDMFIVICVLVGLHWVIAVISFYSDRLGNFIKSSERKLVVDGKIIEEAMQKSKIGKNDLMQALREEANIEDVEDVKTAYIERDGNITVIPKRDEPQIIEVKVEEGVQTVRIVLE